MGYGYGYGYPMMYGDYGVMHAIFSIIWVVISITIIIAAIRWVRGKSPWHNHGNWCGNSALDILNERYAKGEINKQEFEEKKKDLEA
jgi:putative membrane protein